MALIRPVVTTLSLEGKSNGFLILFVEVIVVTALS